MIQALSQTSVVGFALGGPGDRRHLICLRFSGGRGFDRSGDREE